MSNGASVAQIEAVDASARQLYHRTKTAGPAFQDIATVVRRLHAVLKHLKVEAEDADSLLNVEGSTVYARQLTPLLEDCDFTLKQLDTILEKYGGDGGVAGDPDAEARERDMMAMIRTKLANQKTSIDMFLDTVQLHNPSKAHSVVVVDDGSDANLNCIKDKVDAIAERLYQRRDSGFSEDGEDLWQQFQVELEKEGFSTDVLRKNKDVLRAYIRELESTGHLNGGQPPTVRGLLEYERSQPQALQHESQLVVAPASGPLAPAHMLPYPVNEDDSLSPKEMYPSMENEKYIPSMKAERRMPEQRPYAPGLSGRGDTGLLEYDRYSSDDDDDDNNSSSSDSNMARALISTRDLMVMDGMNAQMAGMHLAPYVPQNYSVSPGTSPSTRYLPPIAAGTLPPIVAGTLPPPTGLELSSSPTSQQHMLSISPRFVPPLPPYSSPQMGGAPPPPYGASPRQFSRLAPDRYGMDIPLDASWTKIKRSVVSVEVLERAGVRYEARPEYVAILGVLSRDEIRKFAHQSAEARALRSGGRGGGKNALPMPRKPAAAGRHRANSDSSYTNDEVLWDESSSSDSSDDESSRDRDEKGTKSYPVIVPAPLPSATGANGKGGVTSPASTVLPKPILKNKNENRVHFEKDGPVEVAPDASPRRSKESVRERRDRHGDREHRPRKDRDRERDRDRDRPRDRDRDRDRDRRERNRDGAKDRDRERDRDRDRDRDHHHRRHRGDRDRERDRDGRSERERKEDRSIKKKAWGETLGAVGIGGAAASLLSVLTEAAVGL